MTSASELRRRSQVLGTQVISQGSAMRVGVVSQLWVDLDKRQVVLLNVREQALSGTPLAMELGSATMLGRDAVLVPSETVFDNFELDGLVKLIGSDVVTETGTRLGKVKDFGFEATTGDIDYLILSNLGIPLLPGFLASTYRLFASEIVAVGRDRVIVAADAETRLEQLSTSLLEQFGVGKPPWEQVAAPPALPSAASSVVDDEAFEEVYEEAYDDEAYEEDFDEVYAEEDDEVYAEDVADAVVDTAAQAEEAVDDFIEETAENITDATEAAAAGLQEATEDLREAVEDLADEAKEAWQEENDSPQY